MGLPLQAGDWGKRPAVMVEIYLPRCSRTYGEAPCTASLGVTGSKKCYNTFATCQDPANFSSQTTVVRFASERIDSYVVPALSAETLEPIVQEDGGFLLIEGVPDGPIHPSVVGVELAPTALTPGKGLGVRARAKVHIADHPWTDVGDDPYLSSRTVSADSRGSFWGRFLSRHRYYENRRIDIITGFMSGSRFTAGGYGRKTYIIAKIAGPGSDGKVSIECRDPLRLADSEKSRWPRACQAVLLSGISAAATVVRVAVSALTNSVINEWLAGQPSGGRYIRIGNEILRCTSASIVGSEWVLSVLRATMPTWYDSAANEALSHDAGAAVQVCWAYDNALFCDVIHQLLSTTGIPSSYLPLTSWQADADALGFQYLTFSRLITEPSPVKQLVEEITKLNVLVWWDERAQLVRCRGVRFSALLGARYNDDEVFIAGSVSVSEAPSELATQVWIYFNEQWPLADRNEVRSFRALTVRADLDKQAADAYGSPGIYSNSVRWLSSSQAAAADSTASRILQQNNLVRKVVSFAVDYKDSAAWVGDVIGLKTRYVQDDEGYQVSKNYLVTQAEEVWGDGTVAVKYTAIEQFNLIRVGVIAPSPMPNYSLASPAQRARYAFISPASGTFADGTAPYQIV